MKLSQKLILPLLLTTSTLGLSAQTIEIDFENPGELATNWAQTFGQPDTMEQRAGAGTNGSTGVVHVNDVSQNYYVHFNHLTDLGGFQGGMSLYAKIHFVQVGVSNTFQMGFITDPAGVGSLSESEVTADWMGVNLTCRSDFTSFRAELWGYDHESGGSVLYRSGAGHPESFIPIPDGSGGVADGQTPVDVWLGLEIILIDNGNGDWDIQSKIDVLSADGTTVVIDDYAVYNYSMVGGADDGHTTHPALSGFSDFYNATSLYAFVGTQLGADRNFAALDDLTITVPEGGDTGWHGYAVDADGYADTGDWLGMVYVENDPWIWSVDLGRWAFVPSKVGWVYLPR